MKNKELFTLNPDENNLVNDGVVEINTAKDDKGLTIIRHELKTFVCEGEYQKGIYRILDTFLKHIDEPKQPAVWVSGFFGSGKSHLVKMLGYLWEDFNFPNGDTAKKIKALPQDVNDLFIELERKQNVNGKLSVSGTLKDFPSADIRYSFLQLFLNELGLPQQYHHFKFIYWAKQEGIHDQLKTIVEAQGKDFKKEYENLFVSSTIAKAILDLKPGFAENEAKVKENFKANFKRIESINREQLIDTIKTEILPMFFGNKIPLTLIVLDEVQQFIGLDGDKSIDLQNLAQDICSNFDGKFLLVGTGQNALSDIGALGTGQYQTYDQAGNPVGHTQTGSGYLQHQFNAQDFANNVDPGYAFRLQQGQDQAMRQANLGGGALSGNALAGLQNYTQGQASQEYQNAFNRYQTQRSNIYNTLASIAGLGQTSLGQTGQMSTQTGANIGNAIQNAGSAQAAGQVGTANAIGGGLTGAANSYLLSSLLKPQTQGWNSAWGSPSNPVYTPGSDSFVGPMAVQ